MRTDGPGVLPAPRLASLLEAIMMDGSRRILGAEWNGWELGLVSWAPWKYHLLHVYTVYTVYRISTCHTGQSTDSRGPASTILLSGRQTPKSLDLLSPESYRNPRSRLQVHGAGYIRWGKFCTLCNQGIHTWGKRLNAHLP